MRTGFPFLVATALLLQACVYYNGIYNAQSLYREAEHLRLSGADSLAAIRYEDVVRKAAKGFRRDVDGPWADDALYLLGRARLRLGHLQAARAALEQAVAQTDDEQIRLGAGLYVGAALLEVGDGGRGTELITRALSGLREGPELAEAHLLRAGVLFAADGDASGWWDLDQAAAMDSGFRTEAAMERVRWGVRRGDLTRVREGARLLLSYPEAASRRDSVISLLWWAAERWGPQEVASLLGDADYGWGRMERGDALLTRAELLYDLGDSAGSRMQAEAVAGGFGEAAAEARVLMAGWRLARARDLSVLDDARRILLPSEENPDVARFLAALERTAVLTQRGLSEPLAWFAAAEVARDALGAPVLARGLFLAYADGVPDDPWAAKALLAALAVSNEEGDRAWLRGRLESRGTSPYVLAARGVSAPGFQALEEELARRLAALGGE